MRGHESAYQVRLLGFRKIPSQEGLETKPVAEGFVWDREDGAIGVGR